jgi:hypothetical protein
MSLLDFSAGQIEKFLPTLTQASSPRIISPFKGYRNIFAIIKIGFIGSISLVLAPIKIGVGLLMPAATISFSNYVFAKQAPGPEVEW